MAMITTEQRIRRSGWLLLASLCLHLVLLPHATPLSAQGIILSASGPVNRSMGGASTAAPLDAIGSLYWNPATTSALANELEFGVDFFLPVLNTASSVEGLGGGSSGAEPGVTPLPSVGWVFRQPESSVTFGLGVVPLAGVNTNYPASNSNPLFLPQSNAPGVPGGLGRLLTEAAFLQLAPTISVNLSERLSVAFGPTITMGKLVFDPLVVGPANDADGSGAPRYGSGRSTRWHWGGGLQLGAYYATEDCWHFGLSVKSPQWMEKFRFFSEDELGNSLSSEFAFDLPMIVSLGTAYSGWDRWVLAMDLRYFDFRNTRGIGDAGFDATGALQGIDHSNVFAMATGAQFQLSDGLYARFGYTFNQSPHQDADATLGVAAPLFYQHQLATGGSLQLAENVWMNLAYTYYLEAELSGPILTAAGAVPGSNVTTTESVHNFSLGTTVRY